MKRFKCSTLLIIIILSTPLSATASSNGKWYLAPHVGFSQLSNLSGDTTDIGAINGKADIDLDSGFAGGLSMGYQYNSKWATELSWEYRSNDSQATLADSQVFSEGNYASNVFHINGLYHLAPINKWDPYLGAGISWIQEIDIDLEGNGPEQSFSGNGNLGYQLFAGVNYTINTGWAMNGEIRYGAINNIDLKGENNAGTVNNLEYTPLTLQVGARYNF